MGRQQVSVIIPTHNRAHVLPRALTSVLEQSCPPMEVIVVDDGSTDGTEALIQNGPPRVRYLRQENQGVAAARNQGIRQARGEWLAFLDSDDAWLPEKLERQLEALGREPQFLLCHTNEIWIRRGKRVNAMSKHAKSGGYIYQRCLPLCVVSPSSVVVHRSLFERVGLFDESLPVCEDYDLWLRICAVVPVLYLEEPLIVKYGGHVDQLSRRYWGMDRYRIRALENILQSQALSPGDRQATLHTLLEKIDIYLSGARKRGKRRETAAYRHKRENTLKLLQRKAS